MKGGRREGACVSASAAAVDVQLRHHCLPPSLLLLRSSVRPTNVGAAAGSIEYVRPRRASQREFLLPPEFGI